MIAAMHECAASHISTSILILTSAINFTLGFIAHMLDELRRRRLDARMSGNVRVGTDAVGRA